MENCIRKIDGESMLTAVFLLSSSPYPPTGSISKCGIPPVPPHFFPLMLDTDRAHVSHPPLAPLTSIPQKSRPGRNKSASFDPASFFPPPPAPFLRAKSRSSPSFPYTLTARMPPNSDDETDDDDVIYTARRTTLRTRLFGGRSKADTISTNPGQRGAGETETELDEPVRVSFVLHGLD